MEQRSIEMPSSTLNLIILNNGKLVIGELLGEKVYRYDLIKALKENGIVCGYIENCLGLLEGGFSGQIPIAQAYIDNEPGSFIFTFEDAFPSDAMLRYLRTEEFPKPQLMPRVKKGQVLAETASNPHIVLRYPDGRKEILQELAGGDIDCYEGENTHVDTKTSKIVANIDGTVHRTAYGVVHVHPIEKVRSIGKVHGKINYKQALLVEGDIRSGADLVTQSNLWVGGMIRAADVEAKGSIHSNFGFDNPRRLESAKASAGQSIYTSAIRQYRVRADAHIFVKNIIDGSILTATNSVNAPLIVDSEIRVGNKLIAHSIKGDTRIFLGRKFLRDSQFKEQQNFHKQHEQALLDMEANIRMVKDKLLVEQKNSAKQLNKLKNVAPDMILTDVLLKRYFANQNSSLNELNHKIAVYEQQIRTIMQERLRLAYYENQFRADAPPRIYIVGKVDAGVSFFAATQQIKLKEEQNNIIIFLDPLSGKLKMEKISYFSQELHQ